MTMPKYDLGSKVAIIVKRKPSLISVECGIITAVKVTKLGTTYDIRTVEEEYHNITENIVYPIIDAANKVKKLILSCYECMGIQL